MVGCLILILTKLLDTPKTSSAAGTDETNLATRGSGLADSRRTTDVLVVTTTERMLHRVLRHTPDLRPAVTLDSILVVRAASLEERLVGTAATSDNTDLGTGEGGDGLLAARRKAKTGRALVLVVRDDNSEATRAAGEGAAVSDAGLNVADNGTLRNLLQREHVADGEGGLLSAVNELPGVHALGGDHELRIALVSVSVKELDLSDGSAPPRVVKDLLDDTADIATSLGVVDGSELHGALSGARVGLEDRGLSLPLGLFSEATERSFS